MHVVDFDELTNLFKEEYKIDFYGINHPKLKIDDVLGEQLRQHFFAMQLTMHGMHPQDAIAKAKETVTYGFKEQNSGRKFNFWHYVQDLMGEMKTTSKAHYGECVINRTTADPNSKEDLIQVFCYPYIAQGSKFAALVIEKILDHFGVDELKITSTIKR